MRHVVIAQGMAFYGCGFFTTDLPREEIVKKLKAGQAHDPSLDVQEGQNPPSSIYVSFDENNEESSVQIEEFKGSPQEEPVILFDTGSEESDMKALRRVFDLLK